MGALLRMRALRSEIAVFALVVHAKDDEAAGFCRHHGFSAFASDPRRLMAPTETFRTLPVRAMRRALDPAGELGTLAR